MSASGYIKRSSVLMTSYRCTHNLESRLVSDVPKTNETAMRIDRNSSLPFEIFVDAVTICIAITSSSASSRSKDSTVSLYTSNLR